MELTYEDIYNRMLRHERRADRAEAEAEGLREVVKSLEEEVEYLQESQPSFTTSWKDVPIMDVSAPLSEVRLPLVGEVAVTRKHGYDYRVACTYYDRDDSGLRRTVQFFSDRKQSYLSPEQALSEFLLYAAQHVHQFIS